MVLGNGASPAEQSQTSSWEKLDSPLVEERNFRRDRKRQKFLDLVERYAATALRTFRLTD